MPVWNPHVHHRVHESQPWDHILRSHSNSDHIFISYSSKIYFNVLHSLNSISYVVLILMTYILFVDAILYQYFVDVVPTEVNTFMSRLNTYQYSVKDHERPIDHHKGSHGIPGIFFKYDMSALKVQVTQERDSPMQFIVRLSATIAGICVISGECRGDCIYTFCIYKAIKSNLVFCNGCPAASRWNTSIVHSQDILCFV